MSRLTPGRRRPDTPEGDLPDGIKPGDYWKILGADGSPKRSTYASNLTGECWHLAVPLGRGDEAYSLANLTMHTVRENADGTISVLTPGAYSLRITDKDGSFQHARFMKR